MNLTNHFCTERTCSKPRDMMRACLEGVCFHFRWLAEALEVLPMKRAILVGMKNLEVSMSLS